MKKNYMEFSLGLDVSEAIASYRSLIQTLNQGGTEPKIIEKLSKSLDELEQQFAEVNAQAAVGVKGVKGTEQYQRKLNNVASAAQILGQRIYDISQSPDLFPGTHLARAQKDIKATRAEIEKLKDALYPSTRMGLRSLGFDESSITKMIQAVDKSDDPQALAKMLEIEKGKRSIAASKAKENFQKSHARETRFNMYSEANAEADARLAVKALNLGELFNQGAFKGVLTKERRVVTREQLESAVLNNTSKYISEHGEQSSAAYLTKSVIESVADELGQKVGLAFANINFDDFASSITSSYAAAIQDSIENTVAGREYAEAAERFKLMAQEDNPRAFSPAVQDLADNSQKQRTEILQLEAQEKQITESLDAAKERDAETTRAVGEATKVTNDRVSEAIENQKKNFEGTIENISAQESLENSLNRITSSVKSFFSVSTAAVAFRQLVSQTFRDVQQLDKSFASIALVTNQSVSGLWSTYGQYADMATQLGQSTDSIIKASALFYQQGLDTNEALALTTDTMKLATLAGNDYETATQEMTAALRGFKMEMDEGAHITDVYSELAAHAAASVDDIAKAMSRTASIGA